MSNQETLENGNGGAPAGAVKFTPQRLPKTEDQLIRWASRLKCNEENSQIRNRHQLGKAINNVYKKNYGNDDLQKIADASGYSKSTLHKACKFAENFSDEKVSELLRGSFPVSWRDIAQNLRVNPDDFVKVYTASASADEFRNAITKLKDPDGISRKLIPLYRSKKGTLNREYRLLMKNQIEYRDYQLLMKELEIAELKDHMAELTKKLARYEEEVPECKMTNQSDDAMVLNLGTKAA
jgi:hypothetical protein